MRTESIVEHLCSAHREQLIAHSTLIGFTVFVILSRFAAPIFRLILKIIAAGVVVALTVYVLRTAKAPTVPSVPVTGSRSFEAASEQEARTFHQNSSSPAISAPGVPM